MAAGPSLSGWPFSSRTAVPSPCSAAPSTGWNASCAVRPMTSAACLGSSTPGSSTMIRFSPERTRVGSTTPSASARWRSTLIARSVAAASASTVGESFVSKTSWVPPRRSRPRRGAALKVTTKEIAMTAHAATARQNGARNMKASTGSDVRKEGESSAHCGGGARAAAASGRRATGARSAGEATTTAHGAWNAGSPAASAAVVPVALPGPAHALTAGAGGGSCRTPEWCWSGRHAWACATVIC